MKKSNLIKIISTIMYLAMIVINYLANALPFNNKTTGQISDLYPNLFAPAPITFSIWGLIYLSLAVYLIYQWGIFKKDKNKKNNNKLFDKINIYFIISSLANILWIFCWHYDLIGLSVIAIISILLLLIKIVNVLRKEKFSSLEKVLVSLPFSIYFAWIVIATIANITVFLVSINWNGFGLTDKYWTIIMLVVGAAIGIIKSIKDKNIFYNLVFLWAYFGIWLKYMSDVYLTMNHTDIIIAIIFCIAIFLVSESFLLCNEIKKK
jgi:hypothetical protein